MADDPEGVVGKMSVNAISRSTFPVIMFGTREADLILRCRAQTICESHFAEHGVGSRRAAAILQHLESGYEGVAFSGATSAANYGVRTLMRR